MTENDQPAEEPRAPEQDDDGDRREGDLAPGRTGSSLPESELDDTDDKA